jgi:hypothetical protein
VEEGERVVSVAHLAEAAETVENGAAEDPEGGTA